MILIAILFSQVKVQSADQSETFLISGIPKEYDDLAESVQLEWFLQNIDSGETVQVHSAKSAILLGDGIIVQLHGRLLRHRAELFIRQLVYVDAAPDTLYMPDTYPKMR